MGGSAVIEGRVTYLECGWDVEAKEQTTFRRQEFLEKRRDHLKYVVGPLDGWAGGST